MHACTLANGHNYTCMHNIVKKLKKTKLIEYLWTFCCCYQQVWRSWSLHQVLQHENCILMHTYSINYIEVCTHTVGQFLSRLWAVISPITLPLTLAISFSRYCIIYSYSASMICVTRVSINSYTVQNSFRVKNTWCMHACVY